MGSPGYAVSVDWSCVSESVSGVSVWCDALDIWPDCTTCAHVQIIPLHTSLSKVGAVQGEMAMLERDSETALYLYTKAEWKRIIQVLF